MTMGILQPRGCTLVPEDSSISKADEGSIGICMPGMPVISICMPGRVCVSVCCRWLSCNCGAGICVCATAAAGTRRIKRTAMPIRQHGHIHRVCQISTADASGGHSLNQGPSRMMRDARLLEAQKLEEQKLA